MVCAMGNSSTLVLLFNKDRITSVRSSSATVGGSLPMVWTDLIDVRAEVAPFALIVTARPVTREV